MRKLSTEEFLKNFYSKYPTGLGLNLSEFVYESAKTSSITYCTTHYVQVLNTANRLMQGIKGCKQCKSDAISKSQSYSTLDFIRNAKMVHRDRYDYSLTRYVDSRTPVRIVCKKHGEFSQNPQSHWNGYGCPHCGYANLRKSTPDFIKEALIVHGDRYTYNKVDYINNQTAVTITCNKHGDFSVLPKLHVLHQRGCPQCYPGNVSWVETAWLDSLGVPYENRQHRLKIKSKSILVDALVGNTVYEFWGDFWHGNPERFHPSEKNTKCNKTFGELYEQTMKKRELLLSAGFYLVEIWETDFRKNNVSKR